MIRSGYRATNSIILVQSLQPSLSNLRMCIDYKQVNILYVTFRITSGVSALVTLW